MDPNRTIRAPLTIKKSSNAYSGLPTQPKFRLLNSVFAPKASTAINTQTNDSSQQYSSSTANVTSRIPIKPSGLIKPKSVRHIISGASTTSSSIKPPAQQPASSPTQSHHIQPTSRSTGTGAKQLEALKLQSIKSAVRKPTALNAQLPAQTHSISNGTFIKGSAFQQRKLQQPNNQITSDAPNIFDSLPTDVGEIRRLLEGLMEVLRGSNDEKQETLAEENDRLKRELAELKDKLRFIKSAVGNRESIETDESSDAVLSYDRLTSDVFYSPMN